MFWRAFGQLGPWDHGTGCHCRQALCRYVFAAPGTRPQGVELQRALRPAQGRQPAAVIGHGEVPPVEHGLFSHRRGWSYTHQ